MYRTDRLEARLQPETTNGIAAILGRANPLAGNFSLAKGSMKGVVNRTRPVEIALSDALWQMAGRRGNLPFGPPTQGKPQILSLTTVPTDCCSVVHHLGHQINCG